MQGFGIIDRMTNRQETRTGQQKELLTSADSVLHHVHEFLRRDHSCIQAIPIPLDDFLVLLGCLARDGSYPTSSPGSGVLVYRRILADIAENACEVDKHYDGGESYVSAQILWDETNSSNPRWPREPQCVR